MTSNFTINKQYNEQLEASFTFDQAIFNTNNQSEIFQHSLAFKNVKTLDSWTNQLLNVQDANNYFIVEYRWSYDNINWSSWINMPNNFSNFSNNNPNSDFWLHIRYTYITDGSINNEIKSLDILGTREIDEIYQPAIIKADQTAIYTNQDTYKVFNLQDFNIYLKTGNITDLDISYRFTQTQGRIWSQWIPLTSDNLKATKIERLKFCNFQFSFINKSNQDIYLYDLELLGEFQNVTANYNTIAKLGLKTQCNPLLADSEDSCCKACSDCDTPWNDAVDCNSCEGSFVQINDRSLWSTQIKLYNELNKFISSTNSWKCTYLLTDADGKGIDHILHEQQIHNVISMKDVNIMIPDNQFPVDNMTFSGLDLDLIQSFEIHILKDTFKKTFGVEFRPSKKDVVYICDINQLWEVEQMFPKRGFMNAESYYRIMMKKYNDKASRQFASTQDGQDAKSFIDSLTKHTTLDNLFGLDNNTEIKKNTKTYSDAVNDPSQQFTQKTMMSVVKSIDTNKVARINEEIWNSTLTVSKYNYKIAIKSKNIKSVIYNSTDQNLIKSDNRAISFWFKTEQYDPNYDWTILSNYDYVNNLGYKINIYQGALSLTLNNNTYSVSVADMSTNVWYSVLVNVDQIQQKLELVLYTRQNENGIGLSNSKLVLFKKMIYDIVPTEFNHTEEIFIGGCDTFSPLGNQNSWNITNIRLWNQIVGKNGRADILNQNVVADAHLTFIVDNAETPYLLPQYGNL